MRKTTLVVPLFLLKTASALLLSVLAPALIFLLFISIEPREIGEVNNYLYEMIKSKTGKDIKEIKTAKLSFDNSFSLYYIFHDLILDGDNYHIYLKQLILRINPFAFFNGGNFIRQADLIEPKFAFDISLDVNKKNISPALHTMMDSIYSDNFFLVNKIYVKNGELIIKNTSNKTYKKIFISKSNIKKTKGRDKQSNVWFIVDARTNENNLNFESNCIINQKFEHINCDSHFDDLSSKDIAFLMKNGNKYLSKYSDGITGKYDLKLSTKMSKKGGVESSSFSIMSEKGSINIKDLFGGVVNYQNLVIEGRTKSNDMNVDIHKISALIATKKDTKYSQLSGNVSLTKNYNINTTIKLNSNDMRNLDVLWPTFLDQLDIRKWVIEHVKSGQVSDIYTYLNFNFIDEKYKLDKVDASINLENVLLNYNDSFPPIAGINGRAVFTEKDMKIKVDTARSDKTIIKDGEIHIDFCENPVTYIDITASTSGNTYYLGYYIDYDNRDKIRNIITDYFNGFAQSKAKLRIPIVDGDGLDIFKLSYIDIQSRLTGNNNFIFKDNSSSFLSLNKPINSDVFKLKLDLQNSKINFDFIDLVKEKNVKGEILADLEISKTAVLMKNIKLLNNKNITLDGEGIIENGILKELNIKNIKYNNSFYDVAISSNDNNRFDITLGAKSFRINFDKNKHNLVELHGAVDLYLSGNVDNLYINNYQFSDVGFSGIYTANSIDFIKLNCRDDNIDINGKKKDDLFNVSVNIEDFGKLLYRMKITENLIGGNLYAKMVFNKDSKIDAKIKMTDKFDIITKNVKKAEVYRSLLDSKEVSEKLKRKLLENNLMSFSEMEANLKLKDSIVKIDRFLFKSTENSYIGFSGFGVYNLDTGGTEIDGLIIPFDNINTLFGMNKIPIVRSILFKNKDGGLLTIGYKFRKSSYKDNYTFRVIPSSVASPNFIKNAVLLFMFL
ncbi:MAG: hypothetical protein LBG48_05345 [Rickettsiales bacterium]|jgi:hypothetical protein|nr:hypothetical protein [Rickettsiales bacterium]